MEIAESKEGGTIVLAPSGRLDSNSSKQMEDCLLGHISQGANSLVVDFVDLAFISSAGLRVLLMGAKRMKKSGGKLALCSLDPNILEVFKVSGFDRIFVISEDRAEALKAVA